MTLVYQCVSENIDPLLPSSVVPSSSRMSLIALLSVLLSIPLCYIITLCCGTIVSSSVPLIELSWLSSCSWASETLAKVCWCISHGSPRGQNWQNKYPRPERRLLEWFTGCGPGLSMTCLWGRMSKQSKPGAGGWEDSWRAAVLQSVL